MGAAHEKGVMLVGKGRSLVIDHVTGKKKKKKKKILQPFSSIFCLPA